MQSMMPMIANLVALVMLPRIAMMMVNHDDNPGKPASTIKDMVIFPYIKRETLNAWQCYYATPM